MVAMLALGCATPEDGFVGRYSGSYECLGSFQDGSTYEEGPTTQVVDIDRATDGSVFLAGACTFPLDVIGPTRAEIVPTSCNVTLNDGSPAIADVPSGVLELNEPNLAYSLQIVVEAAAFTVSMTCTFDGTRIE